MDVHPELNQVLESLPIVGHARRSVLAHGNEMLVAARRTGPRTVQVIYNTFAGSVSERGIRIVTLTANETDAGISSWSVAQAQTTRTPGTECESRKGTVTHALPVLEAFWARAGAK